MNSAKKKKVGVFLNSVSNKYSHNFIKELSQKALLMNTELHFFVSRIFSKKLMKINHANCVFSFASHKNLDGLICLNSTISSHCNDSELKTLLARFSNIPRIIIGGISGNLPNIHTSNYDSVYKIVEHLITKHHCRKITFLSCPLKHTDLAPRYKAYSDVLKESGLEKHEKLVLTSTLDGYVNDSVIHKLLGCGDEQPDAIVCANDNIALSVFRSFEAMGIKVPKDIVITGFDNLCDSHDIAGIGITTVDQQLDKISTEAIDILHDLMQVKIPDTSELSITIPGAVKYRGSCGCVDEDKSSESKARINFRQELQLVTKYNSNLRAFRKSLGRVGSGKEFEKVLKECLPSFGIKNVSLDMLHKENGARISLSAETTGNVNSLYFSLSDNICIQGFLRLFIDANAFCEKKSIIGLASGLFDDLVNEIALCCIRLSSTKKRSRLIDSNKYKALPDYMSRIAYRKLLVVMDSCNLYTDHNLSLEKLSSAIYLSRNKVSYIINRYTGKSYYEFINRYRLRYAKRLLQDSKYRNQRIIDVAYNSGFKSIATFNKVFRQETNMSPSQFRSSHLKENISKIG